MSQPPALSRIPAWPSAQNTSPGWRRGKGLFWGLVATLLLGTAGCSENAHSEIPSTPQVVGGRALGAADALAASVLALVRDDGVQRVSFGTAVVVGRRTLLTAAHVFVESGFGRPADVALEGALGPVFGVRIRPSQVTPHPAWIANLPSFGGPGALRIPAHPTSPVGDLAVVTLDADLPDAWVPATLDDEGVLTNTDVLHVVGHGWSQEPNGEGRGLPSATPTTTLYRTSGATPSDAALEIRSSPVDPRTGVCDGDSGGPLFKETRDGSGATRYVLVGILSRSGSPGCAGQVAVHTSVAATSAFWKPLVK